MIPLKPENLNFKIDNTKIEDRFDRHQQKKAQRTTAPRYYQVEAVKRVIEAIAGGQRRVLLIMTTGTGKN